jgi:hypothetical protein
MAQMGSTELLARKERPDRQARPAIKVIRACKVKLGNRFRGTYRAVWRERASIWDCSDLAA